MKTIGIIAPNFGRPKILELWCASIQRIRQELVIWIPAVVISGEEDKKVCDRYLINHIVRPNKPVSEKFNAGMEFMRENYESHPIDYVIISGSDDIFSSDTVRQIMCACEEGYDVVGIDNIYFYGTEGMHRGKFCQLKGTKMLGVGKTISRKVLDMVDWRPWTEPKNNGMDWLVTHAIMPHAKSYKTLSNTMVVDCKSKTNLNSMNLWVQKFPSQSPDRFYSILSDRELTILNSI